jgi:hypothetical protein
MYNSIKKTYTPLAAEITPEEEIISRILILREPEGPSAVGQLASTSLITWEDMRHLWKMAVQKIYNPWRAYLIAGLLNQYDKKIAAKQQADSLLNQLSKELEKKHPTLFFEFIVATPAGTVRAQGGLEHNKIKSLLGIAESFSGRNLCTTRTYDEATHTLADFFTSGMSYYNKYSGTSFSHVLQVVVARKK